MLNYSLLLLLLSFVLKDLVQCNKALLSPERGLTSDHFDPRLLGTVANICNIGLVLVLVLVITHTNMLHPLCVEENGYRSN